MADLDRRTPFERYCRQPGTRINAIMTRLERGEDERSIADRYKTQPATIRVYRKALEGRLSKGSARKPSDIARAMVPDKVGRAEKRAQIKRQVIAMWREGVDSKQIGLALGMSTKQVSSMLYREKKKGRIWK